VSAPAHAVSVNAAFAVFSGPLDSDGLGGASAACSEVVATSLLPCSVTFTLKAPICQIGQTTNVGIATYTSQRPGFTIIHIRLNGLYAGGQGVLQSDPIVNIVDGIAYVFEMTIDAHKYCVEGSPVAVFQGKVTYL
jgi:hypothetical protein